MVLLLITSVGVLGLFGCGSGPTWKSIKDRIRREFPDVSHMSAEELDRVLDGEGPAPLLLDVRQPEEFAVSHLKGAIRVDPGSSAEQVFETFDLDLDPDTPIVAYCSVGYRSSELVSKLAAHGARNVKNLDGSIFEWANAGLEVEREGHRVHEVHPFDEEWGVLLKDELRAYEPRPR